METSRKLVIFSIVGTIAGVAIAWVGYRENKKRNKEQSELWELDKQIKQLELLSRQKAMAIS